MKQFKIVIFTYMVILLIFTGCTQTTFGNQADKLTDSDIQLLQLDHNIKLTNPDAGLPKANTSEYNIQALSSKLTASEYKPGELPIKPSEKLSKKAVETEKVVFLTFDDGPSIITPGFLDVLKANNVHGTFCVIGDRAQSFPDIIKRMYDEGHSIISHSHSHVFKEIYASPQVFLNSIEKSNAAIDSIVQRENIEKAFLRFPGGTTRSYRPIIELLKSEGYNTLDWNVSSNDCSTGLATARYILNHSIKDGGADIVVLLMHDFKYRHTTLEALNGIIKHYRNKGYKFKTIRNMSPYDMARLKDRGISNILY